MRGFVLGKFMPPHQGHFFLCETALRLVDGLTVLVCSLDGDPIPGAERAAFMRERLPSASVRHLHRDMPQEPADHPEFWRIWREAIRETHPEKIDRVFASEPYVFRLAGELGASPILVDPDRDVFPISGTKVRGDPEADWRAVPHAAAPANQKRLCLLGPESVGKSRLATELAAHFSTRAMPEYGRTYDVHYKQGKNWRAEDLITLAEVHRAMREALAPHAGPLLIEDTDAIQTAVWAKFLLGDVPEKLRASARETPAHHYFLLAPDVEWVNDGVRYAGDSEIRQVFFDDARHWLEALRLTYDIIDGDDWTVRSRMAIKLAEERFGAPKNDAHFC